MCDTTLADAGWLKCTRDHDDPPHHGCVYESTSGVPDAAKEEF